MSDLLPTDIEGKSGQFKILWNDGHEEALAFRSLRLACPCAQCIDEWTRKPLLDPASVSIDVRPLSAEYVGRYALAIQWSDGHSSGIFPFEMLRALCECKACLTKKS